MKLDNQKNTYRIWVRRLIMAISFTIVIILLIFIPLFDDSESWFNKYLLIALVAFIYVVVNLVLSMKTPTFISYNDQGDMIIFRYYPLSMFISKKNSIEIPKQQFVKYELKPFYFGKHQKIILYQDFRERIVSYPPISLSAMDEKDRKRLLSSLDKNIRI